MRGMNRTAPHPDDVRALASFSVLAGLPHVLAWPAADADRWRHLLGTSLDTERRRAAVAAAKSRTDDDRALLLLASALMLNDALVRVPRHERREWLKLIGDPGAFLGPAAEHVRPVRGPWPALALASVAAGAVISMAVRHWH